MDKVRSVRPLRGVCVLGDGIRGHLFQSRGVAGWLARDFGLGSAEFEIPRLTGWRRWMLLKIRALALRGCRPETADRWIVEARGTALAERVRAWAQDRGFPLPELLFLSTGSAAAPFALALARTWGARCATIMTPSVLGIGPFDAAVVPRHDNPDPSPNVFVTLGAPNAIVPDALATAGRELLERYPPRRPEDRLEWGRSPTRERWALLLGGDDANYRISGAWVARCLGALLVAAAARGAELFITTSRRTSAEAERALLQSAEGFPGVRMLLLASRDSWNPVPGLLGAAHRVFCTEDSVSMVSEGVSGGHRLGLLRVERRGGIREWWADTGAVLARWGVLGGGTLRGVLRFDALFQEFLHLGYVVEFGEDPALWPWDRVGRFEGAPPNEARSAAAWLAERWGIGR